MLKNKETQASPVLIISTSDFQLQKEGFKTDFQAQRLDVSCQNEPWEL